MSEAQTAAPRKLRVFLCHASGDKPAVRDLYARLSQDGFAPWLDEEDLIPGDRWEEEIPKAVRAAHVVLVCLSSRSIRKEGYLQKEIKFALDVADEKPEGTTFLIPVKLDACPVPDRLSAWHWVDFAAPRGYAKLTRALRRRAEALEIPVNPVVSTSTVSTTQSSEVNAKDGLEYVWIPPGEFLMGAVPGDPDARESETPRHPVRISKGFWLSTTPVTVAAYQRFAADSGQPMPEPPPFNPEWRNTDHPMVNISWDQAQAFAAWAGGGMVSEAEWEYAARGGNDGLRFPWGNALTPEQANYGLQHRGTTPVTRFPAQNKWGLRDMSGNVWEWVADRWDETYYSHRPVTRVLRDPRGPVKGSLRVLRGGSCGSLGGELRVSMRSYMETAQRAGDVGFRLARDVFVP